MKIIEYVYYGILLLGIILIYFAAKQYGVTKNLLDGGLKTQAKVIELIETKDRDSGKMYTPLFEYKNELNELVTFESEFSSNPSAYRVGDVVDIIYSKGDSSHKTISFWGLYRWVIILLCIAAPFLIIGGGYALYASKV